jgi:hypothetical protein
VLQEAYSHEDILRCVDSGIDFFGATVKNVIYFRFKTTFNLERADIVRKPEAFRECLRSLFGERAFNVEASIVASIIGTFHLNAELNSSDSVARAIIVARKRVWSEY